MKSSGLSSSVQVLLLRAIPTHTNTQKNLRRYESRAIIARTTGSRACTRHKRNCAASIINFMALLPASDADTEQEYSYCNVNELHVNTDHRWPAEGPGGSTTTASSECSGTTQPTQPLGSSVAASNPPYLDKNCKLDNRIHNLGHVDFRRSVSVIRTNMSIIWWICVCITKLWVSLVLQLCYTCRVLMEQPFHC